MLALGIGVLSFGYPWGFSSSFFGPMLVCSLLMNVTVFQLPWYQEEGTKEEIGNSEPHPNSGRKHEPFWI